MQQHTHIYQEYHRHDCVFCNTFLKKDYLPLEPWNVVVKDGEGFCIVPSKGALVPGWFLVVGKRHDLCSGSLSRKEIEDLRRGVELARKLVSDSFGSATVFESGPSEISSPIGCGIDHVHIHVVPLKFSLQQAATNRDNSLVWSRCDDLFHLNSVHKIGKPYFYIEEPNSAPVFAIPAKRCSQFLRQVIAAEVQRKDHWDYSRYPWSNNVESTLSSINFNTQRTIA